MLPHGVFLPLGRFVPLHKLNGEIFICPGVLLNKFFLIAIVFEFDHDNFLKFKVVVQGFLLVFSLSLTYISSDY